MNKDLELEILEIKKLMEKVANKDSAKLLIAYKKALDELRADVGSIYMRYSNDNNELNMSRAEKFKEIKTVENKITDMAKNIGKIDVAITSAILQKVFHDSYYRTAYTLDKGIDIGINFKILRPEFINAAINTKLDGKMFSDRIWTNKDKMIQRLYNNIQSAIFEGKSIDKLAKDIKDNFGSSAYESKRLIHNEVARIQTTATDEIYRDSGVVQKVMFTATLDNVTSDICQSLDGKTFDINENYPKIPDDTHIGCRSCYIPIVVEGWSPRNRRENIKDESGNKQIIEYQNYENWIKNKGIN